MRYAFYAFLFTATALIGLSGPALADDWVTVACDYMEATSETEASGESYTYTNRYRPRGSGVRTVLHARNIECDEVIVLRNGVFFMTILPPGGSVPVEAAPGEVIDLVGVSQNSEATFQARAVAPF